jgi:D-psicose/D-tagatose/L-ribulose 3-epimerase
MRLAVSNLAWHPAEEADAAQKLAQLGVKFIELAPTKKWPDLTKAPAAEVAETRRFWEDRGFQIVALQAILFGQPNLTIFDSQEARDKTLDYLEGTFRLSADLGAKILVFGSPKNRLRGNRSPEEVQAIATEFFGRAGRLAAKAGVVLCIEPNAPQYGCDFVTTAVEGHELVARVASPGFALHLDSGCMTMAEDAPDNITKYPPHHFHISAPFLGPVVPGAAAYPDFAQALRNISYEQYISIEMKPEDQGNIDRTVAAVELSQAVFNA